MLHSVEGSDILPLHASAVSVADGTAIFLGPSGAGKSTISQLLSEQAQVLADDGLFVVPSLGPAYHVACTDRHIFGAQQPTCEELDRLTSLRQLRVIFRLYQATSPRLLRIDESRTCRYLTDAFFEIPRHRHYDLDAKRLAFAQLAAIARQVPGYELYFDRSKKTVEMVNRKLESL